MLPAAARAEHRAASVGEQGMKDRLYAADTISSGTERTHEFMCACTCLHVQSLPSTMQHATRMTSAVGGKNAVGWLSISHLLMEIQCVMSLPAMNNVFHWQEVIVHSIFQRNNKTIYIYKHIYYIFL